jgi:hypothetical protein
MICFRNEKERGERGKRKRRIRRETRNKNGKERTTKRKGKEREEHGATFVNFEEGGGQNLIIDHFRSFGARRGGRGRRGRRERSDLSNDFWSGDELDFVGMREKVRREIEKVLVMRDGLVKR